MGITKRPFDATGLMQLKCGYDSIAGEVRSTAITGSIPDGFTGGSQTVFSLYRVEAVEDFFKSLDISGAISVQASFGKGGAKVQFASRLKMHDYSLYIAVHVEVIRGTKILDAPKLTQTAYQLLGVNKEQFRTEHGDEFLAGVTSGGEFIAFLEIKTKSQSEYEELSAAITVGDLLGVTTGSATFHSVLDHITGMAEYTVQSFQQGGTDQDAQVTPEKLLQKATTFANTVSGDNVFDYLAIFQTYDVLDRPAGANPIDVQNQKDTLDHLGTLLLQYKKVAASVEYLLENSAEFAPFDPAPLQSKAGAIYQTINMLVHSASQCMNDYTQCALPTSGLASPKIELPARLTTDAIKGVDLARKAALEAQSYAEAAKTHSDRVAVINGAITPGPDGPAHADEAKMEANNAATAAEKAVQAANTTVAAGSPYAEAAGYLTSAKASAQSAKDASATAQLLNQEAYKKGYAPYWTMPNTILLGRANEHGNLWKSEEVSNDTTEGGLKLSTLAYDPVGGKLEFGLIDPIVDEGASGKVIRSGLEDRQKGPRSGFFLYEGRCFVVLQGAIDPATKDRYDITGSIWSFSFKIRSISSGLDNTVHLTAVCKDTPTGLGPHLDFHWNKV